ncbi:MAG: hypothetical protein DMG28_16720 [Acidobacteria bacterium]|nr:MAG: hypothetical protein DMG28_16720 [Acidobacteriota bacterium]
MKTKGMLCRRALLVVFVLALGTAAGFSQPQQQLSPSADRFAGVGPQSSLQAAGADSGATIIAQVEVGRSRGDQAIVRVEGNGRLTCQPLRLTNPERLVLDFSGVRLAVSRTLIPSALKPVRRVRLGQLKPDVARVVIDLESAADARYDVKSERNSLTVAFAGSIPPGGGTRSPVAPQAPAKQEKNAVHARRTETPQQAPAPRAAIGISGMSRPDSSASPGRRPAVLASPVGREAKAEPFQSAFKYGMLTYRAQNQTLRSILDRIAAMANVDIALSEGLGDEKLSVEFHHYRLDEALRQMLKGYDAFFFYGVDEERERPASLRAVWVYRATRAQGFKPTPPDTWAASTQEFQQMLAEPDPEVRARAIETLIRRKGDQSADALQEALRDKNEKVRIRALHRALYSGVGIPLELLIDLALNDDSMNIRFLALQALPVDPKLRWVAERALHDSNPQVNQKAEEILEELNVANAPPSPAAAHQ